MKLTITNKYIESSILIGIVAMLIAVTASITACSNGMVEAAPVEGDYGQKIVHQIQLSPEQIELLNSDELPKPFTKQTDKQKIDIVFSADGELNPYRVVIVAKGSAETSNQIDVRFAGILSKADSKGRATPQICKEEDTNEYRVSQKATLAIFSEPFSFNSNYAPENYIVRTGLTKRDNFIFESVDIQIWQGVGDKQSSYSYYKLLLILIIAGFFVYRMYHARLV